MGAYCHLNEKCFRNVEQKMNEMIAMVKITQESQFKGELQMNKLQESVNFISTKFNEYEKGNKQKEEKIKFLENNNLKMQDKIVILEKQIDRHEQ